jgi:ParB-like chromosome segregation protein Spo0J
MTKSLQGLSSSPERSGHAHKKSMRQVSVWLINVVAQMRKSFDPAELQELSGSIQEKGVINAPVVARFARDELESYLAVINRLWNTSYKVSDLKPSRVGGEERWYVLLAGERRYRSCIPLVRASLRSRFLQVVIHEHISHFDAIDIQFSENSHRRPPPHEEAHAYAQYWALQDALGQQTSLAQFARRIGRSPSAVKAALRFVSLPGVIRNAVAGSWGTNVPQAKLLTQQRLKLPYGIAVELARLAEIGVVEEELLNRMVGVVISGTKVEQFREQVSEQIESQGQDMLGLLSAAAEQDTRRIFRRRTVGTGVSRTLVGEEVWFAKVLALFDAGLLGKDDSPFALGAVRNRFIRIAELYEQVFPFLYIRPSVQARRRLQIVRRVRETLEQEEQLLPFEKAG